jgi:hypothetical protein
VYALCSLLTAKHTTQTELVDNKVITKRKIEKDAVANSFSIAHLIIEQLLELGYTSLERLLKAQVG